MRIGLNLVAARACDGTGIERFVRNVVGGMRLTKASEILLAVRREVVVSDVVGARFFSDNQPIRVLRIWTPNIFVRIAMEMVVLSFAMFRQDVVLSINNFGPLFGKSLQRRVVVIHDVWFLSRGYLGPEWKRRAFRMLLSYQARGTALIVTVSEFSRQAIADSLAFPIDKIKVVPNCLDCQEGLPLRHQDRKSNVSHNRAREDEFIVLVGTERSNKNVLNAIKGYADFAEKAERAPRLILVGDFSLDFIERCNKILSGPLESLLIVKGYVSRDEYLTLLKESVGLLFVSLYEGFGIPVIEAIACGKRCIVAHNTVCAEISGSCGILVDGNDIRDIANGLKRLTEGPTSLSFDQIYETVAIYLDCDSSANSLAKLVGEC